MAKRNPTAVPAREFFGKYADAIEQGHAADRRSSNVSLETLLDRIEKGEQVTPGVISAQELHKAIEEWWLFRLLRQAAEEGDSEGCKRLLHYGLLLLDIRLPKGVLVPFLARRGRTNTTRPIFEAWLAQGKPPLTASVCDALARIFYAEEFAKSRSPQSRNRMRDRIRRTILRHGLDQRPNS